MKEPAKPATARLPHMASRTTRPSLAVSPMANAISAVVRPRAAPLVRPTRDLAAHQGEARPPPRSSFSGEAAHRHRERLGARVAAHPRDDRHDDGEA